MNGALVGNLQQSITLAGIERPDQFNFTLDQVNLAVVLFTRLAVFGVDLPVIQVYVNTLQRPLLVIGVHAQGY